MDKVSICISTWNRVKDLKICLNSILNQDYKNVEVVVVDNASKDETEEYCRSLGNSIIYIKLKHEILNAMTTLNMAFNFANGKYVIVMDDDAYFKDNDGISKLVNIIQTDPRIFAVSANVVDNYGNPNMVISDGDRILTYDEINQNLGTIDWLEFHGACTIFNRFLGNLLNWYDEKFVIYANELDLSIRASNQGNRVLYTNAVTAIHNAKSSKPQLRNRYHGFKNILYIINEYFDFKTRLSMYILSVGVHTIRMLSTMRFKFDIVYLLKWSWLIISYFFKILNPIKDREITTQTNHHIILNRLWSSYKMYLIGKVLRRDTSMYGLSGR